MDDATIAMPPTRISASAILAIRDLAIDMTAIFRRSAIRSRTKALAD